LSLQASVSAAHAGTIAEPARTRSPAVVLDVAILAAVAAGIATLAQANGGYEVRAWAPAGIALALAVGAFLVLGLRTSWPVLVAGAALAALGIWSVASTAWGGLPDQAWRFAGQAAIAAAALAVGSLAAASGRRRVVFAGVLLGIVTNAAELLFTPLVGSVNEGWFYARTLQGTVGYHNAQAGLMAIGIPLALWGLCARSPWVRACAGAAGTLLVATVLLTQSRAGLGIGILAFGVTISWARSAELLIRAVPLGAAAVALVVPLRDVDRVLVDHGDVHEALRGYAGWAALAAVLVGLLAMPALASVRMRRLVAAALVVGVAVVAVPAAVAELRSSDVFTEAFSDADPNLADPGNTRLVSLSLNGRRDAWRVAAAAGRASPIAGAGQGTFPLAWTEDRRLEQLYLLQPHSIILELFAELGVVGVVLFLVAVLSVVGGIAFGSDRRVAAAGLGVSVAFFSHAALDWTWSFPGLVAAALLVSGAALAGRRSHAPGIVPMLGGAVVLLAVVVGLGAYWQADRDLREGRSLVATDPVAAVTSLERSLDWNHWDPEPLELLGLIAERNRAPMLAADYYAKAAPRSQRRWLDHFREARAAKEAGNRQRRLAACALATRENPAEKRLRDAFC
jgi:hypothetical protein